MTLLGLLVLSVSSFAHASLGLTWPTDRVSYVINPRNDDSLPAQAVIAAIQRAANVWSTQTRAAITLNYAGQTSGQSFAYNQINEVFFRPESPGAIAETYLWSIGATLVDVDIAFYDAGALFVADGPCSNGYYLEDTGAHEFGHVIGLAHSDVLTATMYPRAAPCDTGIRTLDQDDVRGAEAIYPPKTLLPMAPTGLRIVR